jgi:hypothetical protein
MKTLTDWFDRVYILNCITRPDRKKRVLNELRTSGMADVDKVVVYPGVVGAWVTNPGAWGAGVGAWGCRQGHIRILEDVLQTRDEFENMRLESALILEDDVYFRPGALEKLNEFMTSVPSDWGQLYLGGQHIYKPQPTNIPGIVIGRSVNRNHAYAVHAKYLPEIYRHVCYMPDFVNTNRHIDHQFQAAHQKKQWPVYCPARWLAGQDSGQSDINGQKNPRKTWD